MQNSQELYLSNMTCPSCEAAILASLEELEGVHLESCTLSYRDGILNFSYDPERVSLNDIRQAIQEAGYGSSLTAPRKGLSFLKALIAVVVILAAFFVLDYFGLLNFLAPTSLADSSTSLGMLFVIGLITSVHCLAMCGGINLSLSLSSASEKAAQLKAPLLYNLGRLSSYTLIGALLGALGMFASQSFDPSSQGLVPGLIKIFAGLVMLYMSLATLSLLPRVNLFKGLPGLNKLKNQTPFIVGLLNGLMPCGPMQSIQIVAFASANPLLGASAMFLFALGTIPLMLGFGSMASQLFARFGALISTIGAGLVAIMGLSMLSQGGALSGLYDSLSLSIVAALGAALLLLFSYSESKLGAALIALSLVAFAYIGLSLHGPAPARTLDPSYAQANMQNGVQVVETTLEPGSYPNIAVQAGVPVRWNIRAEQGSINGCNNRMIIPNLGIEHSFVEGDNIIEFTVPDSGSIEYSCWMGMIKAHIQVLQ